MDVEAIPIQVQTPPKEDEPEPAPEHSSETMDSIEVPARRDIENGLKNDEWDDDADGEGDNDRHDEIIVGSKENSIDDEEERGAESPLSSAPDSGDEDEVAKSHISVEGSPKPKQEIIKGDQTTAVGKLGDVEGLRARLDKKLGSDELLKHLHRVIYKRPGTSHEVKKNIRDFAGFRFADTASLDARQVVRDKVAKFTNGQLKEILQIFGLQVSGSKDTLVDNIIDFLNSPWDTKKGVTKSRRRSSGRVTKTVTKKKSSDKVKVPQKRKAKPKAVEEREDESPSEEEEEAEAEDDKDEDFGQPPKKKAKITPQSKSKPKPKLAPKARPSSPLDSSDDDVPLRPGPSDAEIKLSIRNFLKSKDLSTVTKGMVKEALREKYGETLVKSKKEVIAAGIEEGMEG